MLWALVNGEGMCEGALEMDAPSAAVHPLPSGWRLIEIDAETHGAVRFLGHAARYDARERRWQRLPEPAVRRYERVLGFDAIRVHLNWRDRDEHVQALASSGQLACLELCPDEALPALPPPERLHPIPTTTLLPGLVVREMTTDEGALFADHVIASGRYPNPDADIRAMVEAWVDSRYGWPLATEWNGRLLQLECYHFNPKDATTVRAGFTVHLNRDRSPWFWRECERPAFEAFHGLGVTRVVSLTRSDRGDWIESLKATYGAVPGSVPQVPGFTTLDFDVVTALSKMAGWPARGTAAVPGVAEVSLAEAGVLIEAAWGIRPRKAEALRIAEDWWGLDSATLLDIGGAVRAVRLRRGTNAGVAALTPIDAPQPDVAAAVHAWCRALGYTTITTFIPVAMGQVAAVQQHLARDGARVLRTIETPAGQVLEVEADV